MTVQSVRPRPALLRALGQDDPPDEVVITGQPYRRIDIFKHDSWAATARYRGADRDVVCKFNRIEPLLGVPAGGTGRWLARRERWALERLAGVPGIPEVCDPVFVQGRRCDHAIAHAYVPGHPLRRGERLTTDFFPALQTLLRAVHSRAIAYVDLHKRENILIDESGLPCLVDFQVCLGCWWPHQAANPLFRVALRALQQADWYHFAKHVRAHRPDQLALFQPSGGVDRPTWIDAHRFVAAPLRQMRRRLLAFLKVRAESGRSNTEVFPEDAIRCDRASAA